MRTTFQARPTLQGYTGILHGGVVASLLDSAMAHCLFHHGVQGLTGDLHIRFVRPIACHLAVEIQAWILSVHGPLYRLRAEVLRDQRVMAWAGRQIHAAERQRMTSDVQITVLVDNDAGEGLVAEHGLSFWVEVAGAAPLVRHRPRQGPVAQRSPVGRSARRDGHDRFSATATMTTATVCPTSLALAPAARLVMHRDVFVTRYSIRPSAPAKAVGISAAALGRHRVGSRRTHHVVAGADCPDR